MWWLWVLLYLVIGIVIAFFQIPAAKESDTDIPVQARLGILIVLWGLLVPLAVIVSVPEILIRLHERINK